MGLDMSLHKMTYVKNWSNNPNEEQDSLEIKIGGELHPNINPKKVLSITEDIMYWRKANQIHGWFASNCSERIPEVEYFVTREDLENLLLDCEIVLELLNKSKKTTIKVKTGWDGSEDIYRDFEIYVDTQEIMEILPPQQGFFFGSYEIDDNYKFDIETTLEFLKEELKSPEDHNVSYIYYASW